MSDEYKLSPTGIIDLALDTGDLAWARYLGTRPDYIVEDASPSKLVCQVSIDTRPWRSVVEGYNRHLLDTEDHLCKVIKVYRPEDERYKTLEAQIIILRYLIHQYTQILKKEFDI